MGVSGLRHGKMLAAFTAVAVVLLQESLPPQMPGVALNSSAVSG